MDYLDELGRRAFDAHEAFAALPQGERAAARMVFMVGWNAAMNNAAAALRHPDAAGVVLAGSDFRGLMPQ
jgi:hypothetical protein